MTGILLLAHGSRGNAENTLHHIAEYVKADLQNGMVEEAYVLSRDKSIEKGLTNLVECGADNIKVIPYFLFEGVHIREHIPAELEAFQARYPHVKITLGEILGADKRLAEIVADQARQLTS